MAKIAVVTGVSRREGLGAAICLELARRGYDIFLTYYRPYDDQMSYGMDEDGPSAILQDIEELGQRASMMEADLTQVSNIKKIFAEVSNVFGAPATALINNACVSVNDSIDSITAEALDEHYAINTRAVTLLTQAFVKQFENGNGRIINIATGWNQGGRMPDELSYVLTKSTSETLTHTLATVLMKRGITINSVDPGPTDTGWMDEQVKDALTPLFPSGRLGVPQDAARLVGFLVSDDAQWITGQTIHSDGGFRD
ncbi:SDR family oxidoreductase [Paenalkalicoccus suaedae]